eukprot:1597646-Rhodomonas_salina.1
MPLKVVPDLVLHAGAVVTCKRTPDCYRWLVDGAEVAVVTKAAIKAQPHQRRKEGGQGNPHSSATSSFLHQDSTDRNVVPAISAKGHAHVSQFAY